MGTGRHFAGILLFAGLLAPASAGAEKDPLSWVHDDWANAKERAIKDKKLVAVDVWATWCHTCLSMKNYILNEPPLKKVAKQHIFLSMDYDRPENAEFFKQFPITAFPTFLVVDPNANKVVARWVGSGTPEQMASFFASADPEASDPLARGQRALADGNFAKAREIFAKRLTQKPAQPERTKILSGYIEALWKIDPKTCAEEGSRHLLEVDNTAMGIDFASFVAYCSESLEDRQKQRSIMSHVRDRLSSARDDPNLDLSTDDRSALLATLADAYEQLGEKRLARKTTQERLTLLEKAAAKAKTMQERTTFDAHRLDCYIALRKYSEAEKMLSRSERAMPKDFNHPWRLAVLYHARARTEEGLKAIDRALAKGYGPRRARLYATKVDLLVQKKDYDAAIKTLGTAFDELHKMDPKIVRRSWMKHLEDQKSQVEALMSQES